jgi:heme A synthase
MVRMHLFTGVAMIVLTFGQAALLVLLRRTVPRDVLRFGLLLPVLLTFQAALGMTRILILHVPIGVFMVLGVLRLALLVWRVTPAEQAPAEQAPAEQAPAEKVPPEQGPAKQGAAKQGPAGQVRAA